MINVVMPKLGLTMKEGRIARWLVKEGDAIEQGEPLFEIETEKISEEIEAPVSGILKKILTPEDSVVLVGKPVAIIAESADEPIVLEETSKLEPTQTTPEKLKVSPVARRLAEEHSIDLAKIKGTGPEGLVVKEDILAVIQTTAPVDVVFPSKSPTAFLNVGETVPLSAKRKTIIERLSSSYHDAIHVALSADVDMGKAAELHKAHTAVAGKENRPSVSYTEVLVKAVAIALKKNPIINSMLEGDQIKIIKDINVGVAVALEDGLIVPVVKNADEKSLDEIASCIKDWTNKAKTGSLSLEDVSGGTFTISNLGMFGVDEFKPIINPPQAAILGVGTISDRPVTIDGKIMIRPMTTLTLVFDHRIFDGVPAALFLKTLKDVLEKFTQYVEL